MRAKRAVLALSLALAAAGDALAQQGANAPRPGIPPPGMVQIPAPQTGAGDGLYTTAADMIRLNASGQRVLALRLLRGAYQIIGHLVFANDGDANGAVACSLRMGANELDYVSTSIAPNTRVEHTLLGAAQSDGGPITGLSDASCQSTNSVRVTVRWARLQAVTVSRITEQTRPR